MQPYEESIEIVDNIAKTRIFKYFIQEHIIHPHWHDCIEILYMINGCVGLQVGDKRYTLNQGEIAFVGKDEVHYTYEIEKGQNELLVFQFYQEVSQYNIFGAEDGLKIDMLMKNELSIPVIFTSEFERLTLIKDYILKIHDEFYCREKGYSVVIRSYIVIILMFISRAFGEMKKTTNRSEAKIEKEMLIKTFNHIDNHYKDDISLESAALAANLSIPHFCRLFKKNTGKTFNEYLNEYRVKKAEFLLNSSKKLSEIALESGFESISSFNRAFKKYCHCSPSEFRKGLIVSN